jgi:hypothetical protein
VWIMSSACHAVAAAEHRATMKAVREAGYSSPDENNARCLAQAANLSAVRDEAVLQERERVARGIIRIT